MSDAEEIDDADLTDATTSTQTRAWWLGTVLALLIVPYPVVAASMAYYTGEAPDLGLALLVGFEVVAFTTWVVGKGVASFAGEFIRQGGPS